MSVSVTIPIKDGKITIKKKADLGKASMHELVAVYNKLSGKKLQKFKDKDTAVNRVWDEILEANPSLGKTSAPKKAKAKAKAKPSTRTVGPMDYPADKTIAEHREGTARAKAISLLIRKTGATLAEVEKATGWGTKAAREGIRILHTRLGYGIKEDDKGRIRLVTK